MENINLKRILTGERIMVLFFVTVLLINMASLGFASDAGAKLTEASAKIGCILCRIANLIFLTAGAIASLVIIMGGLRWVTSADDPGARNGAKTTIISAFVGLVIIAIAVFIVSMVVSGLFSSSAVDPTSWITGCGKKDEAGTACSSWGT